MAGSIIVTAIIAAQASEMRSICPLLLLLAWPASGATVTFEDPSILILAGQTRAIEGFQFAASNGAYSESNGYAAGALQSNVTSNGTRALFVANGATVAMAQAGGSPFSLSTVDVAGTFLGSYRNVTSLAVTGDLAGGGTVSQTFAVNPDIFQTLSLSGFVDVTSVQFTGLLPATGNAPEFQLDNIVTGTGVPEPGSLSMMLLLLPLLAPRIARKLAS